MNWSAIRYRDFYDFPRLFITAHNGQQYLFDCAFDDELDDYPDSYRVYQLPALTDEELQGSWAELPEKATIFLGFVPVAKIRFDDTKRKAIQTTIFNDLFASAEAA